MGRGKKYTKRELGLISHARREVLRRGQKAYSIESLKFIRSVLRAKMSSERSNSSLKKALHLIENVNTSTSPPPEQHYALDFDMKKFYNDNMYESCIDPNWKAKPESKPESKPKINTKHQ
jgi:hypothetical protein